MPQNIGTIARPMTVPAEIQNTRRATLGLSALSGRIISGCQTTPTRPTQNKNKIIEMP